MWETPAQHSATDSAACLCRSYLQKSHNSCLPGVQQDKLACVTCTQVHNVAGSLQQLLMLSGKLVKPLQLQLLKTCDSMHQMQGA